MPLIRYLQNLSTGRTILWCYFIWWVLSIIHHFDPTPRIWLTSLGLSGIIGAALILSTRPSSGTITKTDPWVLFRLFLMPFCVSSFAALVKDAGYLLVFPPSLKENAIGISLIAAFLLTVLSVKKLTPPAAAP
ncbi:MAG: hypothetical protein K9N47_16160 [Prosthecobacter sp.]|uniref:hypothetical protein n=1 Tax=Prosthecobacter sp. TaxID=1965333 RepID=UPI0025CC05F8|nr:hypothetical protein [Prosthecobacter sp.]MCF7787665.1 hypothetical protein [Prosthecobacter sp.]